MKQTEADAVDLLVSPKSNRQRVVPRETEHVFGSFASAADGSKSIHLLHSNTELADAESIMISVHGYTFGADHEDGRAGGIQFFIRAQSGPEYTPDTNTATHIEPSPDEE